MYTIDGKLSTKNTYFCTAGATFGWQPGLDDPRVGHFFEPHLAPGILSTTASYSGEQNGLSHHVFRMASVTTCVPSPSYDAPSELLLIRKTPELPRGARSILLTMYAIALGLKTVQ